LNNYWRSLVTDEKLGCRNECSVCTSKELPCLILEQTEETMSRTRSRPTQKHIFTRCYITEGSSSGKVCLTSTYDFSSDVGFSAFEVVEALTVGCAVSVDGVDCTSCSADATTGFNVADCTNIAGDSSARIDTCNEDRASFPGVFGLLYDLLPEIVTYTLGRCDDNGSSTASPPPTPQRGGAGGNARGNVGSDRSTHDHVRYRARVVVGIGTRVDAQIGARVVAGTFTRFNAQICTRVNACIATLFGARVATRVSIVGIINETT
jgi:hypothetical protein